MPGVVQDSSKKIFLAVDIIPLFAKDTEITTRAKKPSLDLISSYLMKYLRLEVRTFMAIRRDLDSQLLSSHGVIIFSISSGFLCGLIFSINLSSNFFSLFPCLFGVIPDKTINIHVNQIKTENPSWKRHLPGFC